MRTYDTPTEFQVHDDENIKGFFMEFKFLSNFFPCNLHIYGANFKSVEHAYQFKKAEEGTVNPSILWDMTASEVKKWGKIVPLRKDWENIKFTVMHDCVYAKFNQNDQLKKKLLDTKSKYLEETNWWGDTIWGVCYKTGKGKNALGNILMSVRNLFMIEDISVWGDCPFCKKGNLKFAQYDSFGSELTCESCNGSFTFPCSEQELFDMYIKPKLKI